MTDAASAEPIANLEICAYSLEVEEEWQCAETNGGGEYEIAGLAPGEWKVEFWVRRSAT